MKRAAVSAALFAAMSIAPSRALADDEAKVHVDGDSDLVIERSIDGTELWESVCVGACDRNLPLRGQYRLTGRGIRQSLPLALVAPIHDQVNLDVKAAYTMGWTGGIVLVSLAAATLTVGAIALVAGANENNTPCFDICGPTNDVPLTHPTTIAGASMLGVGAFMMAAGIVAIVMSGQTRVRQVGIVTVTPTGARLTF